MCLCDCRRPLPWILDCKSFPRRFAPILGITFPSTVVLKTHKSQIKSNINKINRINTTKSVANVQWTLGQIFGQHICQHLPVAWDYVEKQITHRHYIDSTAINEHQISIYLTTELSILLLYSKQKNLRRSRCSLHRLCTRQGVVWSVWQGAGDWLPLALPTVL